MRRNGGGNSAHGYSIISRLIDRKVTETSRWRTRVHKAAQKAWGQPEDWHEGDHGVIEPRGDKPFTGPVAVLTGPRTYSAAEDFLVPLEMIGHATLIGMPAGGSTGQPLFFPVYAANIAVCTKRDRFPDGT